MGWFTGIVVYLLLWWLALFTVLPWGVRPADHPEEGHDSGAPVDPRLKQKFLITTVIAAIIWLVVYGLIKIDVIDFYDLADQMIKEDL